MVKFNTGSIAIHVGILIGWSNIPPAVSGLMTDIVTQNINFANTFTNDGIGTTNIDEKYQPSLISLTQADTLLAVEANEGGVDNVSLGPLKVEQGGNIGGGNAGIAKQLRTDAISKLKELGRHVRFARVIGGA